MNDKALFEMGRIVATQSAAALIEAHNIDATVLLSRHVTGDWGDLGQHDMRANDDAVKHGERILSCYQVTSADRLYVITEADRTHTTVLLPSEY